MESELIVTGILEEEIEYQFFDYQHEDHPKKEISKISFQDLFKYLYLLMEAE